MKYLIGLMSFGVLFMRCNAHSEPNLPMIKPPVEPADTLTAYEAFFQDYPDFKSDGFDFPVGAPNCQGYYNAQPFGENYHLGDDWNGVGGGNTDLGDPVYAAGNGYVSEVYDAGGGWGNVVRIIHQVSDSSYMETLYAHLQTMEVTEGDGIKKGTQLGTIGNADGAYLAHLHFELRSTPLMGLNGGYSTDTTGYTDPTKYIQSNRRVMWRMALKPLKQ
ncbi:MAG: M23 family metallopeptidase [Flavobacteriales bacterium]